MKYLLTLLVALLALQGSVAPPVTKEKEDEKDNEVQVTEELDLEYNRYLQEVVSALESDPNFRERLMKANDSEIRSGKIAYDLDLVNHQVRSKLDELKRQEMKRLSQLATERFEREHGIDKNHMKIAESHEHLDRDNPHTFEINDLKKLIAKVTKDLDEADKKRREEFKEYEMHKKFEQEQKMKNMTEEDKKKYEHELEEMDKKHKDHPQLHHPGSKKQLEEVWEKQDHMENQEFNPKIFFHQHDLDGNGVWDENELKTLFLQELHKLYEEGHPEDDLNEKAEELERMREHVLKEADLNGDRMISYDEFLTQSKKTEFEQDPGWETLDQQQIYSDQEYEIYKQNFEKAIAKGMSPEQASQIAAQQQFPPHPNQIPPNMQQHGQYQQVPQPHQQYPPGQYPGQVPPQHPGQFNQPQGGYQQQGHPQQVQYGQVPHPQQQQQQQQYHPNDVNYQMPQHHPNDVNYQQNFNPNQQLPVGHVPPPQQQQQYQQPHANQIPQQQQQQHYQPPPPNQVPQQQYQQPPPPPPAPNANAIPQQQQQQPNFQQPPPVQNAIPQQQYQQAVPVPNQQQQQYQQPPVVPNNNAVPQYNPPASQQQQQPIQQQQQQPPVVNNNVNQPPPPQQVQQNHPPADASHGLNQQQQQQQPGAAAGQSH